jgi:hypothetical protein
MANATRMCDSATYGSAVTVTMNIASVIIAATKKIHVRFRCYDHAAIISAAVHITHASRQRSQKHDPQHKAGFDPEEKIPFVHKIKLDQKYIDCK